MNRDVRQLLEGKKRFWSLFEHNPDLILFQDAAGVILDANPAFLEAVHQTRAEVLDRPFRDFLPPDKVPLFDEKLAEAFRGTKVAFEVNVQLLGAEPRVLHVTKVPLWLNGHIPGVHMIAQDVTSEAASRAIIEQQIKRLHTVLESITDAFFLLDKHWTFSFINSEVERLLGMSREQLLGRIIWQIFKNEDLNQFYRQCRYAVATGQAVHFEAFFEPRQLWLEIKAFPSQEGLSVYFTDITDKVKAHEQLYRQNKDLQQFAYIVSHNLRAPLTNMLGLLDLLVAQAGNAPEYAPLLSHLQLSTQQLDTVLHDMNTILTIRDKQGVSEPELVPLAEVIEQVVVNLQDLLEQCGGQVHCTVAPELCVHGNRAYVYSIFFNLLSNAIKYRSEHRPLRVDVTAAAGTGPEPAVQVVVADNGSGFDVQKAGPDVFRLYKRFHSQPAGRGLGLYLVKTHVEAMGGHISVHSEVEVGTRFILRLP
ncbi:PAS domain-containing protein [Hymenobacter sp. DG01]|uniref:sensor histidine kinase n=1 Tax=Hymenobacter sp. DG01 TaxID=2584940 RepID=UPI0015DEBCF0|nr:PAS domain-containing protein [Hymenobacter sp. DG01]